MMVVAIVDFLVVTPLDEEWRACRDVLGPFDESSRSDELGDTITYYLRTYPTGNAHYLVTSASMGAMGHTEAALFAHDALKRWSPAGVLLVGIAGSFSRKWHRLGDVVVASEVFGFELGAIDGPQQTPIFRRGRLRVARARARGSWRRQAGCRRDPRSTSSRSPAATRSYARRRARGRSATRSTKRLPQSRWKPRGCSRRSTAAVGPPRSGWCAGSPTTPTRRSTSWTPPLDVVLFPLPPSGGGSRGGPPASRDDIPPFIERQRWTDDQKKGVKGLVRVYGHVADDDLYLPDDMKDTLEEQLRRVNIDPDLFATKVPRGSPPPVVSIGG
jgi:nucleoside phosphorylase